jgi:hypothetical protein
LTYAWVQSANPQISIAHHLHMSFQLRIASKYKIPSIVLFREPSEALASLVERSRSADDFHSGLLDYIHFNEKIYQSNNRLLCMRDWRFLHIL